MQETEMTVEKVSAGPAMQRPQPPTRSPLSSEAHTVSEEQVAIGGAPSFDRNAGKLVTPRAGMLANPVMQKFTSPEREEPGAGREEAENIDAGAASVKENKKTTRKPSPPKKGKKRGPKQG
jgi:hypothetical protein